MRVATEAETWSTVANLFSAYVLVISNWIIHWVFFPGVSEQFIVQQSVTWLHRNYSQTLCVRKAVAFLKHSCLGIIASLYLREVPWSLLALLQSILILWRDHLSHHSTLRSNDILRKSHHTSLCSTSKSIGHSHSYHHACALSHDWHRLSHHVSHHPSCCRHRNSHGWKALKMSGWLCGKWHRGRPHEHTCTREGKTLAKGFCHFSPPSP